MDIGKIKADDLRTLKIARDMNLAGVPEKQILATYVTPLRFRAASREAGSKCTFRQAELIMMAAGWVRPQNYSISPEIPVRLRRKTWYDIGELVPISKYFSAPAGSRIQRVYKKVDYTALVLQSGKLLGEDFDGETFSPTGWARRVMNKPGRTAIMPQVFWPKVLVIEAPVEA